MKQPGQCKIGMNVKKYFFEIRSSKNFRKKILPKIQ